jgi:hypothetical protein
MQKVRNIQGGQMKYSYFCKNCGHTVLSDKKDDIKKAREEHRIKTAIFGITQTIKKCPLVPVGDGTVTRIGLLPLLARDNK